MLCNVSHQYDSHHHEDKLKSSIYKCLVHDGLGLGMTFRNGQPQKNQTGTMRPNISGQLLVHTGQKTLMAGGGYL